LSLFVFLACFSSCPFRILLVRQRLVCVFLCRVPAVELGRVHGVLGVGWLGVAQQRDVRAADAGR
jgi:hypothetical protein